MGYYYYGLKDLIPGTFIYAFEEENKTTNKTNNNTKNNTTNNGPRNV